MIVARRIVQDRSESDISIISLLEDFVAQGFPLIVARIAIAWAVEREENDPEEFEANLRIAVDDEVLHESAFSVSFQGARSTRSILNMSGFRCTRPGYYRFTVLRDGQTKATYAFRAEAAAPTTEATGPAPAPPAGGAFLLA
jgi:hypothetical protein